MKKAWVSFFLLGLVAVFAGRPFLEGFGWTIYDYLQRQTAGKSAPGIALILVDQESLNRVSENEGYVFPWPRQLFGAIATVAEAAGARGVAYDILFVEPSRYGVDDDQAFADLLRDSGVPIFMPAASASGKVKDPIDVIKKATHAFGAVHTSEQTGGIFRYVPNEMDGRNGRVPTFGQVIFEKAFAGSRQYGKPWLKYYDRTAFPLTSFYNLLIAYRHLQEGRELPAELKRLKDRVWLVGYSAPGLHDLKPTPIDPQAPGMLIPATAVANRLDGTGLTMSPWFFYLLVGASICILSLLTVQRVSKPLPAAVTIISLCLFGGAAATVSLWQFGIWFDMLPVAFGGLICGAGSFSWNYQTHWRERLKLAKSLENSMSPEMVRLIRTGEIEIARFGEEREVSILFSDLAGFTTLSEKLPAEKLVEILNWYLDDVVDLILRHQGYIDKFIGDAVMAIWNAPIRQVNHADLALKTAIEYESVVSRFNRKVADKYGHLTDLHARVGVHSGTVIVGNIGSQKRHNYTAIGDAVNLAARLESMGKMYGSLLLISEDCLTRTDSRPPGIVELDQVIVKGRSRPTRVYTHWNEKQRKNIPGYLEALSNYYSGDWLAARELLASLTEIPPAKTLLERCEAALKNGPPANWVDGVWRHDEK